MENQQTPTSETSSENASENRLNNWIAVSVAIIAAFMAVTKVKDDNIVQAMLQAKSDAVDTWAQYQAKRIRESVIEAALDETSSIRLISPERTAILDEKIKRYEEDVARYKVEEKELQAKAKGFEAQYDALNYRDDQFDLSDAMLSVSLATLAVTALTRKKPLLVMSLVFAFFGILMGIAGLLALKIHPDWLTKLLS